MKFVRNTLWACISLAALVPQVATATPVTLTTGNMQFANPTTVHISNQTPLVTNLWVYSGAIAATASDATLPFEAWCIDIFQHAYFNWSSQDYVRESATVYPGSDKANLLLRLATESLGLVIDSRTSSAFQLATWEIVNETGSIFGLSTGNFTAWGASDDSISLANTWLSGLPGADTPNKYAVSVLHSGRYQDFAVFTPVPEPGTIALLGLGLLGVAASRRKSGARNSR